MSVSKYFNFLLIIFLLTGCSKKNKDISPDTDEAIESNQNGEKPSCPDKKKMDAKLQKSR